LRCLVGERETTHTGLDAEDVVVRREEVHRRGVARVRLERDGNLRVVDAAEVARTSRLVRLRFESEGVRVHTRVRGTGVVHERLHLVEVATRLFGGAVLTVEDQLEHGQRTNRAGGAGGTVFNPLAGGTVGTNLVERGARTLGDRHEAVGVRERGRVGLEDDVRRGDVGRKVPQAATRRGGGAEAPDQFLDRVVQRQAHLLGGTGIDGVRASVLNLFDEVFVRLLGEATALFGVEEDVVTPDLERGAIRVGVEFGREVEVEADFVVLKGDQRQRQTRVAVEEENERQVNRGVVVTRGHLRPVRLLGLVQVKLGVQTPPLLVVLVHLLTTDRQFTGRDGTFRQPARRVAFGVRGETGALRLEFDEHVGEQIGVARNRDRHAGGRGRAAVDGLLDGFHREVRVALVHRLEESHFRGRSEENVLSAVSHQLHETTSHGCSCCTYSKDFFFGSDAQN